MLTYHQSIFGCKYAHFNRFISKCLFRLPVVVHFSTCSRKLCGKDVSWRCNPLISNAFLLVAFCKSRHPLIFPLFLSYTEVRRLTLLQSANQGNGFFNSRIYIPIYSMFLISFQSLFGSDSRKQNSTHIGAGLVKHKNSGMFSDVQILLLT